MSQIRVGIAGVSGRMGRMLLKSVCQNERTVFGGATEFPGHDWVGHDLAELSGIDCGNVRVVSESEQAFAGLDAVLDFTTPAASVELAQLAARETLVHVIGTTGFSHDDSAVIADCAVSTVIIRAGNMSLGVNLCVRLVEKIAHALDEDFDIEIVETHHREKVDAPSGTALMLGEAAARGRKINLDDAAVRGRDGITGPRHRGTIGFSAIRGGDVVGEHDVVFSAAGERIVLRHIATDRSIYARGAVRAALWGISQPAGEYTMCDVLGV
ncbi:MAG: 4-hydroxy-tetrahydrodipicolinate reductase [Rhodobacteraceae bacterium]|nr:4-hydroxy-tetrahydrodipicolinate reductase [Paracoccaceae bacterium]